MLFLADNYWSDWISVDTEGGSGDVETRTAIAKKNIVRCLLKTTLNC